MKASTIFGLAVRLVGLFLLYKTVLALTAFFTAASVPMSGGHISRPALLGVMMLGAAAVWFLFGAPPVQEWAYPESKIDN